MEGEIKALHPFFCSFLAAYFLLSAACVRNMEVVGARCVNCEKKASLARAYPPRDHLDQTIRNRRL